MEEQNREGQRAEEPRQEEPKLEEHGTEEKKIGLVQVEFKGERSDYFVNSKRIPIEEDDYIVVQVERGRDMGKVIRVGEILDKVTKVRRITQEVLRKASEDDVAKYEENKLKEDEARRKCEEKIAERGLKMKLVDVEYQLDSSKITFFFTADERVDFRELVKDLAGIYKTRIELRQIGVRDEAKRLGGYGSCGRRFCCTTWLQEFEPVTLKMARDQSLSVSPTKISGACGRLMCCLAYERDYYMRVAKRLPKVGAKVETPYGDTKVTDVDIFAQAVVVEDENGNEMRFTLDQVARNGPARKASTVWTVTTGKDEDDDLDDHDDEHDDDHDDFDEISDQDHTGDREDKDGR
jgi:cell fate regulator YaaT (PSP1 superfamily)